MACRQASLKAPRKQDFAELRPHSSYRSRVRERSPERESALFEAGKRQGALLSLYGTDPDPQGALNAAIAELPARDRGSCQIVQAEREGWPTDALLIAPSVSERARLPEGRPVVACGPLGIDETKLSYWRVRQGFA